MKQPNKSPFESWEMVEPEVFDADQPDIGDSMFSNISVADSVENLRSYTHNRHPQPQKSRATASALRTQEVVDDLEKVLRHRGTNTRNYEKKWRQFASAFPTLPTDRDVLLVYMSQFRGLTNRHRANWHRLINQLYKHAVQALGFPLNPLAGVRAPEVKKLPIRTISLEGVGRLLGAARDERELLAVMLLVGHGWRQIEVLRLTAGDVRASRDGLILCRGKERDEDTPILPETLALALRMAESLPDEEPILRSQLVRDGRHQALGSEGLRKLLLGLFRGEGIISRGHDLRRTLQPW